MKNREIESKERLSKWKREQVDESLQKRIYNYVNTQSQKIESIWFNYQGKDTFY